MKKAYLTITTWKNSSVVWYAKHYYGALRFDDKRVEVTCNLTETEAKRFNKADLRVPATYRAGDESDRFTNEQKLIKQAIKLFKKDSHGYEVLIEGDHCTCDPQKILVGSQGIKLEANKLYDQFEQNGGWDCNNKQKIERISEQWTLLVGPVWEK